MMNIVLLDTLTFGEDISLVGFEKFGTVTAYQTTQPEETLKRVENADVIVTNKVVISEEILRHCSKLKLICIAATGVNNVDLVAAKSQGVEVKNAVGYSTESVVQLTFAMALYLFNHSRYYDDYVKSGTWSQSGLFTHVGAPFHEISGKTWGIIGMGSIGHSVAKIATAFGAEVVYYSTSGKNVLQEYSQKNLEELLSESDIISIHAPLNDQTFDLINKENLPLLKAGSVLLNLGRGGIINEVDLSVALQQQDIYVGLDVVEKEPISADNPLLLLDSSRLYITPHIAWTSVEARERLIDITIENIKLFYEI